MANPRDHDWAAHNAEVASVWQSYLQGRPIRPPVIFDLPAIYTLSHPETNPQGMDFDEYVLDPEKQIQHQLQAQRWTRFWPRRDVPMGPDSGPLRLMVDDQNIYDAAWLGCPVEYRVGQPPYTTPMLAKHPEKLYDLNVPEPTSGFMAGSIERFEYMTEWANGAEFEGFEVAPPTRVKGLATNGVFTVSCIIRGATNLCVDIYENPQYVHDLLDYVTDAVIARVKGLRAYFGEKWPELGHHVDPVSWGHDDDSIQLISSDTYREFVLPRQKRLLSTLAGGGGPHPIHLCGDAARHFPTLVEELNIGSFDTGFPIDFDWVRENVGPDIEILGGPDIMTIHEGPIDRIAETTRRILQETTIWQGGRFIARDANSVAPGTAIENVEAVYDAVREYGTYPEGTWDSGVSPPNAASVALSQPSFGGLAVALAGVD